MSTLEVKAIQAPSGYDLDMPAGHILQVVSSTYSTAVNNATSSYADTGLTATITPKFSTSKVLIVISQSLTLDRDTSEGGVSSKLLRGSTEIQDYPRAIYGEGGGSATKNGGLWAVTYLDSPNTTSATTYKTTAKPENTANNAVSRAQWYSTPSTITLMEVAQ